jgi:LAGLIDADG-like domain
MSEELTSEMGRETGALVPFDRSQFMPAMSIELAVERYNTITEFVSRVLRRDVDYGMIPGTDKLTLLKPGAEKLTTFFGLSTRFQLLERIEDWTGEDHAGEPFFYYLYRCQLYRGDLLVAEADGSCNSRETKYRYREAQRVCPECGQAAIIKGKEEYGGGYLCLQPDTPVLYADFTWRPIGEAQPGDTIIGFDEYPRDGEQRRKLRPTIIESVWSSHQQTQRLITADSEVLTTASHRWLEHHKVPGHLGHWGDPWKQTDRLLTSNCLRHIGVHNPPPITNDYRAGYLAGITLGDGTMRYTPGQTSSNPSVRYWRIALKESDEAILGRIVAYLAAFGVESYIRPFNRGVTSTTPTGGIYYGDINRMNKVEVRALHRLEVIHNIIQTKETLEFQRGFIAGFFDAEGTGEVKKIRIYQKDIEVLRRVRDYAANLGFTFEIKEREDNHCSSAVLRGGILERFRFFATCQPVLLRKAGLYGASMLYNPSEILAIESGPVIDVVDIQTSTGTFFAAGLATHNCFRKKGGCGAKFSVGDTVIESQQTGRVPNAEIADQVNTIQKMGQKRSLIAATLLAVNASEFFTQDVEDFINTTATAPQTSSALSPSDEPPARNSVSARGKNVSSEFNETPRSKEDENSLKTEILAACRSLDKTEEQLIDYLKKKYGISSVDALPPAQKREVLSFLRNKVAQQRAA